MAVHTLQPADDDYLSLDECVALFEETGYPVSKTTLRRWISKYKMTSERHGRRRVVYVSFTDVLEAHRDEVLTPRQ